MLPGFIDGALLRESGQCKVHQTQLLLVSGAGATTKKLQLFHIWPSGSGPRFNFFMAPNQFGPNTRKAAKVQFSPSMSVML